MDRLTWHSCALIKLHFHGLHVYPQSYILWITCAPTNLHLHGLYVPPPRYSFMDYMCNQKVTFSWITYEPIKLHLHRVCEHSLR